jgi:hypothetical protein
MKLVVLAAFSGRLLTGPPTRSFASDDRRSAEPGFMSRYLALTPINPPFTGEIWVR